MSTTAKEGRSRVLERRRAEQRKNWVAYGAIALGVVLVLGAAISLIRPALGGASQATSFEYMPADVVRDESISAVHEMEAGPPIPFLPASGPQPALLANQTFVDVGSVGPTEIVQLNFAIKNTGEAPLTISRAYTTCGCTTAEISASIIPPGSVAEVTLVFDAGFHDTRGQVVRRGLIIENNDPAHSVQEIWLQAAVRPN